MNRSLSELEIIQNPALGAYLLWRFGVSYQASDGRQAPFHLFFLVLPLVLHRHTLSKISSTQRASGLALFAAKLAEERENLMAIHNRTLSLRRLSLQSLAMGADHRLLSISATDATVRANTADERFRVPTLPDRLTSLARAPEKLGYWCSQFSLHQIAKTLMVDF
ncbi:DUF6521 family protein [Bradyrhizobium ontarionense]|uniref:DUF6521 family protein n=1 Tax=Bradyrhizobium ontarionense TaxID=2898149 RepID=A0ABY3R8G2_9BRAD|nr:three component ABC system middle component [Bradyrhizobium sp. A19]UFZ03484.1 DUF6521 family protein [Bradyrhizobium sp. A19]